MVTSSYYNFLFCIFFAKSDLNDRTWASDSTVPCVMISKIDKTRSTLDWTTVIARPGFVGNAGVLVGKNIKVARFASRITCRRRVSSVGGIISNLNPRTTRTWTLVVLTLWVYLARSEVLKSVFLFYKTMVSWDLVPKITYPWTLSSIHSTNHLIFYHRKRPVILSVRFLIRVW